MILRWICGWDFCTGHKLTFCYSFSVSLDNCHQTPEHRGQFYGRLKTETTFGRMPIWWLTSAMEHSRWLRVNTIRWIFLIRLSVFRYECLLDRMHIPTNTDGCLQRILHENWMRWDEIVMTESKKIQRVWRRCSDAAHNIAIYSSILASLVMFAAMPFIPFIRQFLLIAQIIYLIFFLHSFPLSLSFSLFIYTFQIPFIWVILAIYIFKSIACKQ